MPCNIGYKSFATIKIPVPEPQTFKAESEAPDIDADLLAKLGQEDPDFVEWVRELDSRPLLEEALKRASAGLDIKLLRFNVNSKGMLEAEGKFVTAADKKRLSNAAAKISERWQLEILGIVTELMEYTAEIRQDGEELILEAQEKGKEHPCDYIKVTKSPKSSSLVFEHFKSREALEVGSAKFLLLADKLGVKINVQNRKITEGDPFPGQHIHSDGAHHHGHTHDNVHHHHNHELE